MSKNMRNLTDLKNPVKLKKLQAEQQEIKSALVKNADRAQELRRSLLLNAQARELLLKRHDELEKAIALLDGRLTIVPSDKIAPLKRANLVTKTKPLTKTARKNIAKRLHQQLSADEVQNFITQLTGGPENA